jgi:predicted dehydrogenase
MVNQMISIGVIGYGYWGPNLARIATEAADCRLAAVADVSSEALARAQKQHPSAKLYQSWKDLLADHSIEAVLIATPVSSHFELALSALKANRHVLIEKPFTSTSAEARILVHEAAQRELVLMVDHTLVYTPAVHKIHELIQDGRLGDVYYYDSTRANFGLFQRDVNVIWDLAVHDMSILQYLLGESPVAISASGTGHFKASPENIAHLTLFYEKGMVAYLNVNWLAPVKVRQTLIGGSKRMVVYNDLEPSEKIKVYDRGVFFETNEQHLREMRVSYRLGDMWAPQLSVREALLAEIEHFVRCIVGNEKPITPGESGLEIVVMLEAAMVSLRQRGTPIEVAPLRRAS